MCVTVLFYFFCCVDIEVLVRVDRDQHLSDVRLQKKKKKESSEHGFCEFSQPWINCEDFFSMTLQI